MASNKLEQRIEGAYIELDMLIGARFSAKDLKLQQHRKALSLLAGPNKTNFRGRGIDFEEVRSYQPGDDIRTIDWRVTARSGNAYTKLFQEERERPVLVVTDQRQPMFFGSRYCFKSVMAAYLSALITWSGLNNNDRVGGLVFGNQQHREIKPRRNRQSALAFMQLLQDYNHQLSKQSELLESTSESLHNVLQELRRIAKPGSAIYIISDFAGFESQDVQKQLFLLSKHCEITALYIYDLLEQELPPPGQYLISNGSQRNTISTESRKARDNYKNQFVAKLDTLKNAMGKLGIPLISIATDEAPVKKLLHYYGNKRS